SRNVSNVSSNAIDRMCSPAKAEPPSRNVLPDPSRLDSARLLWCQKGEATLLQQLSIAVGSQRVDSMFVRRTSARQRFFLAGESIRASGIYRASHNSHRGSHEV